MDADAVKALAPYVAALLMGAAGVGAGTFTDLSGAKAWKQEVSAEIAAAARLKDRVVALEAQQQVLLQLIENSCRAGGE